MIGLRKFYFSLIFSALCLTAWAQSHGEHDTHHHTDAHAQPATAPAEAHQVEAHAQGADSNAHEEHGKCGHSVNDPQPFSAGENAVHHISDANAIHVYGDMYVPLPVILKSANGWKTGMTTMFHPHHHGNGSVSSDGYVLVHAAVMRLTDAKYQHGEFKIDDYTHQEILDGKKKKMQYYAVINGECTPLEAKTTYDGGILGGGVTGFMDFSITRNVFTMLLTALVLFLIFRAVAGAATKRRGQAPKGLQNFIEPFYTFIRDEVAKPMIGHHYEKYMPYLMSAFFFILGLNLIGQIPFFPGSANVTGNISVTIVLAVLTFLISTFSANKHFWEHTLWMPGVPAVLKVLILTPIEILGLFLKPFTLLLRLFANITAGHIVILSFVSLIFILGKSGESSGGGIAGIAASVPLSLFMMTLELLVAFLQAFIFTMLSATYIGTAVEEPHHH